MARTLNHTDIDKPEAGPHEDNTVKEPIVKVAWCCKENPDDTSLLIAGGHSASGERYLTFWDLGPTPIYATSTWRTLAEHFVAPREIRHLPTPPREVVTLSFPSGYAISPTNLLHISMTFVHPYATKLALSYVDRSRWIGWREKRSIGPAILKGGSEAHRPMKRFETRDIVQVAHADGTIRLWDAGHDDHIENPSVLQVDLPRAVGRDTDIVVTEMSLSGASGEFAVGLQSGEVAIFRWGPNVNFGTDRHAGDNGGPNTVLSITHRAHPSLKEGFVPYALLDQQQGPVTALKQSDIGFVAVGYKTGAVVVIDLRVPK
ncbi:hypothetical protein KEM55_009030, partial [Ascosphaera atra]